MCRNIKPLFNFDPPATDEEIRDASIQFVRKLTGIHKPSITSEESFNRAAEEVAVSIHKLFDSISTNAKPRNCEIEAERARVRNLKRFPK